MKQPYALSPDDRADESVRNILRQLFNSLRSNIDGVLEDLDIECLHDLRVAIRRTRTVLSQIKGVLEPSAVARFSPDFKWLGAVTGPCRDLDVTLLEMRVPTKQSGIQESALDPFRRFLEERRKAEHGLLVAAFRTPRFCKLVEGWDGYLSSSVREEDEQSIASSSIIEVAGPRILKAFERIRKRGAAVEPAAAAELLHRLRIDGKKLRYLLEFFAALFASKTVSRCIKELKRLQDILGEFNDTKVQLDLINEFSRTTSSASASNDVMNQLTNAISERQSALRIEFIDRFTSFAGQDNRRLYEKTFRTV